MKKSVLMSLFIGLMMVLGIVGCGTLDESIEVSLKSDAQTPTVYIFNPFQDITNNNFSITVLGLAVDNKKITGVYLSRNNSIYRQVTGTDNWSTNITDLDLGSNLIKVYSEDNSGNTSLTSTVNVFVDTNAESSTNSTTNTDFTPPTLLISAPADNTEVDSTYSLQGLVADNDSGVDKVYYSTDNGSFAEATVNDGIFQATINLTNYGTHTNYVYAIDNMTNTTATQSVAVQWLSDPVVVINSPTDGITTNKTYFLMNITATVGSPSTLQTIEVRAYGSDSSLVSEKTYLVSGTSTTIDASVVNLSDGTNTIIAKAIDNTGKTATTSILVIVQNILYDTIYVSLDGNDGKNGRTPDNAVLSIQRGVELAQAGGFSNVYVESGVYTPGNGLHIAESNNNYSGINIVGANNINITGGWNSDFITRAGYTILDGNTTLKHIIWAESLTNLTIDGFVIRNGKANVSSDPHRNGGGVYFNTVSQSLITNCIISNNTVSGSGGGIYLNSANSNTISGPVSGNSAGTYGGGVYLTASDYNIISGTLSGNSAGTYGGGVLLNIGSDYNTISGTISGNSASIGGGVYLSGANYNTINATISGNSTGTYGGGVCLSSSDYNTINGTISGNSTGTYGGGVFLLNSSCYNTISGAISGNSANYGGGVYLYTISHYNTISGTISGNSANYGGGVFLNGGNYNAISANVQNNTSVDNGGGIYINTSYNTISGTVSGNESTSGDGGGVFIHGTYNTNTGNITGNTANNHGGGVYLDATANNNVINGWVQNNTSVNNGGGLYIDSSYNTIGCSVSGNDATSGNGGGIYIRGTYNTNTGNISGNTANIGGGVCIDSSDYNIISGTVSANTANNGGGVGINQSSDYTTISGDVLGNTANYGGGVWSYYNCYYTTISGTVSGNTANTSGGGVNNVGSAYWSGSWGSGNTPDNWVGNDPL